MALPSSFVFFPVTWDSIFIRSESVGFPGRLLVFEARRVLSSLLFGCSQSCQADSQVYYQFCFVNCAHEYVCGKSGGGFRVMCFPQWNFAYRCSRHGAVPMAHSAGKYGSSSFPEQMNHSVFAPPAN